MITLITVNYNCANKTLELLRSLERQMDSTGSPQADFDVIVVDNDSRPEDRAMLGEYASSSPLKLDIIYSETNRGFSGGNNLAIRKALAQESEWVLLINPDTTVGPNFIASLRLPSEPCIIGLPLREGDHVVSGGVVRWLRPTLKHTDHPDERSYIIGAGMLIHRDIFEKIGFLDERYFLYFEDADFSLRARRAGITIQFASHPVINHGVSQSTKQLGSPLLLRYHMRNSLLFNKKYGPWWVKIALPFWAFFASIKQIIKLITMPARRPQSRAILAGIIDFYAHRFGKILLQTDSHWH